MTIWLAKPCSVGVAGWCSAWNRSSRASNSAGSSPGRMSVLAYRPYLRPLRLTAARPSGVDGPVLFCAFKRLASICCSDDMAHLRRVDCFLELEPTCGFRVAGDGAESFGADGCGWGWVLVKLLCWPDLLVGIFILIRRDRVRTTSKFSKSASPFPTGNRRLLCIPHSSNREPSESAPRPPSGPPAAIASARGAHIPRIRETARAGAALPVQ